MTTPFFGIFWRVHLSPVFGYSRSLNPCYTAGIRNLREVTHAPILTAPQIES